MTWKIDPSYTWHRCDSQGPLCATTDALVGDVDELPGGSCIVCTACANLMANEIRALSKQVDSVAKDRAECARQRDELKAWKDAAEMTVNATALHGINEVFRRIKETP